MLELAGFMKHLHDGIPIRRHLENGREDKICIRGAGEAGDDGVAWDGLCCSKARTSFTWEELKEVRTYSRATIGKTVHPTATLAKSPMPSGAKAADVDLTFSLILEDGWSLDLTCNSAPGHHLAVRGFELARKIGEGGFGVVYVADAIPSLALQGACVVKLLSADAKQHLERAGQRGYVDATVEEGPNDEEATQIEHPSDQLTQSVEHEPVGPLSSAPLETIPEDEAVVDPSVVVARQGEASAAASGSDMQIGESSPTSTADTSSTSSSSTPRGAQVRRPAAPLSNRRNTRQRSVSSVPEPELELTPRVPSNPRRVAQTWKVLALGSRVVASPSTRARR